MLNLIYIFALLLAIVFLSYRIMIGLAQLHAGRYGLFRAILFPGVAIHEFGHLLACWLTNTQVVEVNLWSATGGHVVHHKPKWPIVQPIISFAPFLIGITLLLLFSQIIGGPWWQIIIVAYGILVVAATLAPSKADFLPAIEGSLLLLVVIGLIAWQAPTLLFKLQPTLQTLQNQLIIVALIMGGLWLGVKTLGLSRR